MELTTDNLFALDMLKNSDLYDPLPVQRIARDVATHAELFTRIHLISVESKRCLSFGDDQPFPDSAVWLISKRWPWSFRRSIPRPR